MGSHPMTRKLSMSVGIFSALIVLAADQASKWWVLNVLDLPRIGNIDILPVLSLSMVGNRGITFGLLSQIGHWGSWALAAAALAIVAALGIWLRRAQSPVMAVALGAIAGGAVGNVIDRLRFGMVIDFIHAHAFGWSWYVFNIADAAIVCGVAALMVESLCSPKSPRGQPLAGVRGRR